jgi:putative selenium metabolism hydrolase
MAGILDEKRKQGLVALCGELIREKSYSGEESGVAEILSRFFRAKGFDEIRVDEYGNAIGSARGSDPGPAILFDGHMDTVPVGDAKAWKHDPFGAQVEAGRLYGRGTSDMKGAIAAMASAIAFFLEDRGRGFGGSLHLAGVVHEECFEGVAARKISAAVKPDFVVIGEASELDLKIAQRGRAEIVVETFGLPAHSANPEKGVNAVYQMTRLVDAIRRIEPPAHPVLGKGILELTDIKSSPYPGASVVPSYCRATYDRRLLVGETRESVLAPIQAAIDELASSDPKFSAKASYARGKEKCYTGTEIEGERFFPGWVYGEDEGYIAEALKAMRDAGLEPRVSKYNFCTNGSHYAGEAGIRTIGYGPSYEHLAHTIDEYVELEQLYAAAEGYYRIIEALQRAGAPE